MSNKIKILIVLIIVLAAAALWLTRNNDAQAGRLDVFSQCLRDKGVTMYGAEWCSHCQAQKQLFGKSFQYIPYVECPQDPQRCLAAGIEAYPTWITASGEKMVGEQKLDILSQKTNCAIEVSLQ